ncbi:MAG TPA: hypothetical protein VH682_26280 [Gemmataceae bacterium]
MTPWVPLMHIDGPPESLLERCAEKIEREAHPKDRVDLLAVSQVLGGLKFPLPLLADIFGGEQTMLESPFLQKMRADTIHKVILAVLKARFGSVPRDVSRLLLEVLDEEKLTALSVLASQCPDLESFREALLA